MHAFAFVGAGPAALVLAERLADAFPEQPIVLVDGTPPEEDARTFGFWADEPTPYDDAVFAAWDQLLAYGTDHRPRRIELGPYRYRALDIGVWRGRMRDRLCARPGVRWVEGDVVGVHEDGAGLWLELGSGGVVQARQGFDSRYDSHAWSGSLLQSFHGWWVRTEAPAFAEGATFMDFRLPIQGGVRFWYVLPTGPTRALVMAVTISEQPMAAELEPYAALVGFTPMMVERVEAGVLPMDAKPVDRRVGERMLKIGLCGGRIKPSTGYGLMRFVSDAEAVVGSLRRSGHPFGLPDEPFSAAWMDEVFLRGLREFPEEAPAWFMALFDEVEPSRLFRFLDGHGTPADLIAVARVLPLARFLGLMA